MIYRYALLFCLMVFMTGCTGVKMPFNFPFDLSRIMERLSPELQEKDVYLGDEVFIRIFKEEHALELWMRGDNANRFRLIKTYRICEWSGNLGPKYYEGDHQAPEGFYYTDIQSLNPNSRYHLSFNVNFPNAYDRMKERTGSFIMVHGDCVSEGCYAMTDRQIEEIYLIVDRALAAGQVEIPIHIFPFRMTNARMASAWQSPNYSFLYNLKEGYDFFEANGIPPKWSVRNGRYEFY